METYIHNLVVQIFPFLRSFFPPCPRSNTSQCWHSTALPQIFRPVCILEVHTSRER